MKKRTVKFAGANGIATHVCISEANDMGGVYALHRVKGLIPITIDLSTIPAKDLAKNISKNPVVKMVFPSVEGLERHIDHLIGLRTKMLMARGEQPPSRADYIKHLLSELEEQGVNAIPVKSVLVNSLVNTGRNKKRQDLANEFNNIVSTLPPEILDILGIKLASKPTTKENGEEKGENKVAKEE